VNTVKAHHNRMIPALRTFLLFYWRLALADCNLLTSGQFGFS
jgi:hypothetical protein